MRIMVTVGKISFLAASFFISLILPISVYATVYCDAQTLYVNPSGWENKYCCNTNGGCYASAPSCRCYINGYWYTATATCYDTETNQGACNSCPPGKWMGTYCCGNEKSENPYQVNGVWQCALGNFWNPVWCGSCWTPSNCGGLPPTCINSGGGTCSAAGSGGIYPKERDSSTQYCEPQSYWWPANWDGSPNLAHRDYYRIISYPTLSTDFYKQYPNTCNFAKWTDRGCCGDDGQNDNFVYSGGRCVNGVPMVDNCDNSCNGVCQSRVNCTQDPDCYQGTQLADGQACTCNAQCAGVVTTGAIYYSACDNGVCKSASYFMFINVQVPNGASSLARSCGSGSANFECVGNYECNVGGIHQAVAGTFYSQDLQTIFSSGGSTSFTCGLADNAQFISQVGPPTNMNIGQTTTVSVTMKNTGSTTWTKAAGYKLGSQNPQDNTNWGLARVELDAADSIAPGQQKTFSFTVTAPSAVGIYNFQWRMLKEGVAWFGDYSTNVPVTVVPCESGKFLYSRICREYPENDWRQISNAAGHCCEGSANTIYDTSGGGNMGSMQNSPARVDGKYGKALSFDGSSNYVSVPNSPSLNPTNAITVSYWIKKSDASAGMPISKGTWNQFYSFGSNQYSFRVYTSAGNLEQYSGVTYNDGNWHMLAATWSNTDGKIKIYKDGSLAATSSGSILGTLNSQTNSLYIGAGPDMGGYYFKGVIDEVQIYPRALTEQEVSALYLDPSKRYSGASLIYRFENYFACQPSSTDKVCCPDNNCVYNGVCYAEGTKQDVDGDGIMEKCVAGSNGEWIEENPFPNCGNGVCDTGENCLNCPNDCGCLNDEVCQPDGTCKDSGGLNCNNNGVCDYDEACNCADCLDEQDKCLLGLICGNDGLCGCNPITDEICPNDPYCKTIDPDCGPYFKNFTYVGDQNYFNVFWNARWPSLSQNPTKYINVTCILGCDPRTETEPCNCNPTTATCSKGQMCLPYPFYQPPGEGSCTVSDPNYDYAAKNKIICHVFNSTDASHGNWY